MKRNEEILDELRHLLRLKKVRVSDKEKAVCCLDGLPLKIEEERRTEAAVFLACYVQYNHPIQAFEREYALADQRRFELLEFTCSMRLTRTHKGLLPGYVLSVYEQLLQGAGVAYIPAAA